MEHLFTGTVTIERILLAEVIALAVLLVMLRGWRAIKTRRKRRKDGILDVVAAPVIAVDWRGEAEGSAPAEQAQPVMLTAIKAALAEPAGATPVPVWKKPAKSGVARPVPSRPRPEDDDGVLSPESLLERARDRISAGAIDDAALQLRLCVRLAAKQKQPDVEANARLELGDLARISGDLTTACEHWQMARSLFTGLRRHADQAAAEKRMENAGCPTDWVLNQF